MTPRTRQAIENALDTLMETLGTLDDGDPAITVDWGHRAAIGRSR